MPYKDSQKRKEYGKEYYQRNREMILKRLRERREAERANRTPESVPPMRAEDHRQAVSELRS
jgi:hypothetical protein